jgi:hypothetical protein
VRSWRRRWCSFGGRCLAQTRPQAQTQKPESQSLRRKIRQDRRPSHEKRRSDERQRGRWQVASRSRLGGILNFYCRKAE